MTATDDRRLPAEPLSPLAARVDEVLALYGYELAAAIEAIDAAVSGIGGVFGPDTSATALRAALDDAADAAPGSPDPLPAATDARVVLYVDGSSRGNPGPAGAGAVVRVDGAAVARLGRPVGSRTDNNVAEYAALQLGLETLSSRCSPAAVEVRIDSMTVVDDIWGEASPMPSCRAYSAAVAELLSGLPADGWTHLADSDPNPADARATVGADIAALGPGG
ncbi:ribonuclease H [Halobacteriales archaeon QS_4_69_225]|nr:MAG: ribonuclease H [Halobacteriales archaeon QS_4_69_225]